MWTKIKIIGSGILVALAGVFFGLWKREEAERAEEQEQIAENATKTVRKNTKAIVEGDKRQARIENEDIDTVDRNILQ